MSLDSPDGKQIKVSDENAARVFLNDLLTSNKSIVRFELREPSLHEIFVEKVGEDDALGGAENEKE